MLPASDAGIDTVRRAAGGGRRPQFSFVATQELGGRIRLSLVAAQEDAAEFAPPVPESASTLDQKIIDYLRQTEEWDPDGHLARAAQSQEPPRADRLLPFEFRARRQYRDDPRRGRRPKR